MKNDMVRVEFEVKTGGIIDFTQEEWDNMSKAEMANLFTDSYYWDYGTEWEVVHVKPFKLEEK